MTIKLKIKILKRDGKQTPIYAGRRLGVGDVVEVDAHTAQVFTANKAAEIVKEKEPAKTAKNKEVQ